MKACLLAIALLAWASGATARPRDSDCRLHRLSSSTLARIAVAARPVVDVPLDFETLSTCRHRAHDWFTATFDTIHVAQPDGSERWQYLTCASDYWRRTPWTCERWSDYRGVRVEGVANLRPAVVVVPADLDVTLARRRVEQGFSLLVQPGETASCEQTSGMKTLPELRGDSPGERRSLQALRDSLLNDDDIGPIDLALDDDGFALSRFPYNVHFVFDEPDGAPRVRCWSETVVLVTS